jgi:hypothetical protein
MDMKIVKGSMLCSDLLKLRLQYKAGRKRDFEANLEEIWHSGAIFLTDVRVPVCASMSFTAGGKEFRAIVIARRFRKGLGYFVEVQFATNSHWSEQIYRPKHLFNPLMTLANKIFAATPHPPVDPTDRYMPALFEAPLAFTQSN